ncbi:hypothetical protein DA2_1233 [Desulfovibrio sp. A2]|nr:hypothetical protein DA2_1233 [Desulfovibrio sp. A2]
MRKPGAPAVPSTHHASSAALSGRARHRLRGIPWARHARNVYVPG